MKELNDKVTGALMKTVAVGVCAAVLCGAASLLGSYTDSVARAADRLQGAATAGARIDRAVEAVHKRLSRIEELLPSPPATPETLLLRKLDEIKHRFGVAEIGVQSFEQKENELQIPISISDGLHDYTTLINNISYLEGLRLPAFTIQSVTIEAAADKQKAPARFVISGRLHIPKTLPNRESHGEHSSL
ncbi:MAG TPA: hypothetical protein VK445_04940 [Dissulfurispiraceae bacterium]|nr:hypothetical protein [Dissulfurispiraceae bacterium]